MTAILASAAYLNTAATSLAAANWSDATGAGAGAELIIPDGTATIASDLDISTNAIDVLHILPSCTRDIAPAGTVTVKFASGAQGDGLPRFKNAARAGSIRVTADTNSVAEAHLIGGAHTYIVGGDWTAIGQQAGRLYFGAGATFAASGSLEVFGGRAQIDRSNADGDALPTLRVGNGGQALVRRGVTTLWVGPGGVVDLDIDPAISAITTVYNFGRIRVTRGAWATIENFGVVDVSGMETAQELGSTAFNQYPGSAIIGRDNTTATISNITAKAGGPQAQESLPLG